MQRKPHVAANEYDRIESSAVWPFLRRFQLPSENKSVVPRRLVSGLIVVAVLSGCYRNAGPATSHLQGHVTLNGQVLPVDCEASLTFQTTRAGQGRSCNVPIVNGSYDAPAVANGPVLVLVDIQVPTGKMKSEAGGTPFAEYRSLVPDTYSAGISQEIQGDDPAHHFELK
jgi:hypothetical protein